MILSGGVLGRGVKNNLPRAHKPPRLALSGASEGLCPPTPILPTECPRPCCAVVNEGRTPDRTGRRVTLRPSTRDRPKPRCHLLLSLIKIGYLLLVLRRQFVSFPEPPLARKLHMGGAFQFFPTQYLCARIDRRYSNPSLVLISFSIVNYICRQRARETVYELIEGERVVGKRGWEMTQSGPVSRPHAAPPPPLTYPKECAENHNTNSSFS